MISLHSYEAQDWSGNGECGLYPDVCDIKKVAAGLYELELEHQITDDGRALAIQRGMLIKAPVPARETPLISISAQGHAGQAQHDIWAVHITASYARLYNKASTGGKVLEKLKNGVELVYLSKYNDNWHKVTAPSGKTGYMRNADIQYLRTEPYIPALPSYQTAVLPRQVREQLFRVYDVNTDDETNKVKALARHISYGQLRNFVKTFSPKNMELQTALDAMSADLINEHDYHYYTNISGTITADWALKNGVQALLDPDEGAAIKMNAQVVRDNFDIFLLQNTEIDRDVVIESGKNLLGLTCHVNDDNVVTRIMPYGTDAAGKILLLPEIHIDSQYINNYPEIRAIPLQVSEAVERAASGDDLGMTKEQAYEKLRAAVQAKYDAGIDLPDFDIQVKFLQLGETEEYKALKELEKVYLYDMVTVKHGPLGMLYKVQMIGFTFDAVLERYTDVTFGNIKNGADLGVLAGFQLPNGGVSGQKLMPGTVGSQQLRELSVLAAHIGLGEIVNAHIHDATIDKAKIKDFVAEVAAIAVAKIGEAWIDAAWINKLTAEVVAIVTANIHTLLADSATINWAQIANLVAAVTDIVLAKIQTANINWAQIRGLVADTALFTQGASGKLYCADFMATDANIESLSANKIAGGMATFGKLMLMGQDGKLYEINVGSLGEVTAAEKLLEGENVGDYTLTDRNLADGTLTARTLNVQQIFGDNALVRQLIAQCIDTDTLFANLGYINALRTYLIQSDIGQYLSLQSNTGIQAMVTDAITDISMNAVNLLKGGADFDAADGWIWSDLATTIWGVYNGDTSWLYMGINDTYASGGTEIDKVDGISVKPNTEYTFSIDLANNSNFQIIIGKNNGATWSYVSAQPTGASPYRYSFTFKTAADTVALGIWLRVVRPGQVNMRRAALYEGNKDLGFTFAPSEVQQVYAGISIGKKGVYVTGKEFSVADVDGADPAFLVDAVNKIIKALNAQFSYLTLNGPLTGQGHNIVTKGTETSITLYPGNAQAIIDAQAKCRVNNTTFVFTPGSYGAIKFSGFFGMGYITLQFAEGANLDALMIENNASLFTIQTPSSTDYTKYLLIRTTSGYAAMYISNSVVNVSGGIRAVGKNRLNADDGTSGCIIVENRGHICLRVGVVEKSRWYGLYVGPGASAYFNNVCGGQAGGDYLSPSHTTYGVLVNEAASVMLQGQCPLANAVHVANWNSPPIAGTYTPTASPGAYTPPVQYNAQYIYNSSKYCDLPSTANMNTASSVWATGTPRGGLYNSKDQRYSGMWLLQRNGGAVEDIRTLLIGKTIISASLRVHCSECWAGLAVHDLYYMTVGSLPVGGDTPGSRLIDTGVDVTLTQGQDSVIDVKAFIQGRIAAGDDFYGFGLGLSGQYVRMDATCTLDIVYQ